MTERAGLEERVGTEEVAPEVFDLVVREVSVQCERRLEIDEMVRALFEDDHRPARGGEDVGRGFAAGAGADDDRVAVDVGHLRAPADFFVGVPARLRITRVADRGPTPSVAVPALL